MSGAHSVRATRALQRLAEADPAFAALALWCGHRDGEGEGDVPAWTDGRTIYYGPGFEALEAAEQMGVAAHHILHVAFRHVPRQKAMALRFGAGFDARLFNMAADALVNETLLLAGQILPRPHVTASRLAREALKARQSPEQALAAWDVERLYLALRAAEDGQGGAGEGPAGESATEREARRARFAEDMDARTAMAGSGEDEAAEAAEWRQRLVRALEAGQAAGRGLGALGLPLADLPRIDTPWERHLRGLLARAVLHAPEPAWSRPSRRWAATEAAARAAGAPVPVYEPGLRQGRAVPRVVVGIDASSSVEGETLALFAAQVAAIGRRAGAEVHALAFDEDVRAEIRLRGADWAGQIRRLPLPRGGGTDFAPLFARAAALSPSALVVLTDLRAPLPERPGRFPVIWAVPGAPPAIPPWGRVIDISA